MNADIDTEDDSREQILGEAYLLRAYMHFDLLNLYGKPYNPSTAETDQGIPLATQIDIEQAYSPSTVKEVYDQIFEDIAAANEVLTCFYSLSVFQKICKSIRGARTSLPSRMGECDESCRRFTVFFSSGGFD